MKKIKIQLYLLLFLSTLIYPDSKSLNKKDLTGLTDTKLIVLLSPFAIPRKEIERFLKIKTHLSDRVSLKELESVTGITTLTKTILKSVFHFRDHTNSSYSTQKYFHDPEDTTDYALQYPKKIDLNKASSAELMTLKGMDRALAQAIIRLRKKSGRLRGVWQLLNIRTISLQYYAYLRTVLYCSQSNDHITAETQMLLDTKMTGRSQINSTLLTKHSLSINNNLHFFLSTEQSPYTGSGLWQTENLPFFLIGPNRYNGWVSWEYIPVKEKQSQLRLDLGRFRVRTGQGLLNGSPYHDWIGINPFQSVHDWSGVYLSKGMDDAGRLTGAAFTLVNPAFQFQTYFSYQMMPVNWDKIDGYIHTTANLYTIIEQIKPPYLSEDNQMILNESIIGGVLSFNFSDITALLHCSSIRYNMAVKFDKKHFADHWLGGSLYVKYQNEALLIAGEQAFVVKQLRNKTILPLQNSFKYSITYTKKRTALLLNIYRTTGCFTFPRSGYPGTAHNNEMGTLIGTRIAFWDLFKYTGSFHLYTAVTDRNVKTAFRSYLNFKTDMINCILRNEIKNNKSAVFRLQTEYRTAQHLRLQLQGEFRIKKNTGFSRALSVRTGVELFRGFNVEMIAGLYAAETLPVYLPFYLPHGWSMFPTGSYGNGFDLSFALHFKLSRCQIYFLYHSKFYKNQINPAIKAGGEFRW